MSITRLIATIVVAAAITLASVVSAQAPAPAPFSATPAVPTGPPAYPPTTFGPSAPVPASDDCLTTLFNMSDCLTYVENVSTLTVPDKKCCPELAGLVESNPICLCQLLANSSMTESFGITIDVARALKLPSVCGVKTPSVTLCSLAGYPVPGPMASAAFPPGAGPTSSGVSAPPGIQPEAEGSPGASTPGNKALAITGSSQAFFLGLAFAFLFTIF